MAGKVNTGLVLSILVAIIFVFMGIQGFTGDTDAAIYNVINVKGDAGTAFDVIIGIVLVLAGALLVLPTFVSAIPAQAVTISKFVVLAVWLVIIVFGDIIPLLNGADFVDFLVGFSKNLLVAYSILQVTGNPAKKGK